MATLLHSESRRLYSWWWDSHISPKNSKWLQENLTDMDAKVKAMIKLIEEDADSFARRAEMYYKKRPELLKLIEEFYRAYRALAERYNHATGELRQAHRTMAQAFPDQVPFVLADDTPSGSEPDTPKTPHPIHTFFDPDHFQGLSGSSSSDTGITKKGLKQLNDMFQSGEVVGGRNFQSTELQKLKEALAEVEAERDAIFLQYQQSLDKLSMLEKDLNHAQKDSRGFNELTCDCKNEIQELKEALKNSEAERDASLLQYRQSLERLAEIEGFISESQNLKLELSRLEAEKEASDLLYKQCLEKIAALERKLSLAEENLKMLNEKSEKAEIEVKTLKDEIGILVEERDDVALKYKQCSETVSKLQLELSEAQEDNRRLNSEILVGSAKLKGAEEQCALLGKMNESLQLEARTLAQKIAAADLELSGKQAELEKLMVSLQDEHTRFVQVEATLHTLQNLHSQSQEDQRALALELRNGLQMMKDLEICKRDLEVEIHRLKNENQTLNDLSSSSLISQNNLQDEMLRLKEIKEKLEAEVRRQEEQSDALQLQVHNLKEEIEALYKRYMVLMGQVESVGLDPELFGSSVKGLQDENSRLKEISMKDKVDKEVLLGKLKDMEELLKKNTVLESSLSEMNLELQRSKEKVKGLQESCHGLNEEKSTLVSEKAAILSQLQIITETMQTLLEKNTSLQTSLCGANAELEGLRAKSKGLEEFCQLLKSERSEILAERSSLVSRLEVVEKKLDKLETRFTNLEDKYTGLENEKQSTISQVEELRVSLGVEKQERACLVLTSEARLSGLEGRIQDLQEENKYRKKEFEEQLEKGVNAQVEIFILQKFIQDMEDKNYDLLIECQKHAEETKYSEKLVMELESENMIQQVEAEFLVGKIETLRAGIDRVLKALDIKHGSETEQVDNFLPFIITNIRNFKSSLSESKDENQRILVEKSVLTTMLSQLHIEYAELSWKKSAIERESLMLSQHLAMLEDEKHQLLERERLLKVEVDERERREEALKGEVENMYMQQAQVQEQNRFLQKKLSQIKKEKYELEEENSEILVDTLAFSYQSMILKSYGIEKALELEIISEDLNFLGKTYRDLENEAKQLEEKLLVKEEENSGFRASMETLQRKQHELDAYNDHLRSEISVEGQKLVAAEAMNTELCSNIQFLKKGNEDLEKQILQLSEKDKFQEKEIVYLRETNGNLEFEVGKLHEEIEEYKIKEVILASELQERSSEFELWEAEAASFFFDLQISSIREVLLENKVSELGSVCDGLEDISFRRSVEIERMKGRVSSLESEAEALKSELNTCLPLIASLKDNIALLEQNPVLQSKLQENFDRTEESLSSPDGLSELQKLQTRIKVIEDILEKEKETNANIKLEAALKEIEDLKSKINSHNHQDDRHLSVRDSVSETSEVKIGTEMMKDIPLDQASGRSFHGISQRGSHASDEPMLELWEAADDQSNSNDRIEDDHEIIQISADPTPESHFHEKDLRVVQSGQSNKKGNKKSVLERLSSDAQKLMSLQVSVQGLKSKIEPNKRRKKAEEIEYETYRGQIQDMENSVVELMDMNTELTKSIEESSSLSTSEEAEILRQKRVSEQARIEAEKIGRLEVDLQRTQYVLLRAMDEKKSKGKSGMSRSSAAVVLRDFFYSHGRKKSKKHNKKARFCGCLRPTKSTKN